MTQVQLAVFAAATIAMAATSEGVHAQFDLASTAWEVVERSYQRGDSSWVNRSPEAGLYVFTARHYSVQEIRESGPRAPFDSATTDDERLRAFDVFHAHGGTYEVVGDQLLVTITIAKGPNTMGGATAAYDLRWNGDLLEVGRTSAAENETRVTTLRRVE